MRTDHQRIWSPLFSVLFDHMSTFENVIGGRLKLKRTPSGFGDAKRRKKKKVEVDNEEKVPDQDQEPIVILPPSKTAAEVKFEETRKKAVIVQLPFAQIRSKQN
jgi:hypothetical protein